MKVRPVVPGSVVRFPSNPKRRLSDEGDDVPETGVDSLYWHRLLQTKDIERVDGPTGNEPIAPLTTR